MDKVTNWAANSFQAQSGAANWAANSFQTQAVCISRAAQASVLADYRASFNAMPATITPAKPAPDYLAITREVAA